MSTTTTTTAAIPIPCSRLAEDGRKSRFTVISLTDKATESCQLNNAVETSSPTTTAAAVNDPDNQATTTTCCQMRGNSKKTDSGYLSTSSDTSEFIIYQKHQPDDDLNSRSTAEFLERVNEQFSNSYSSSLDSGTPAENEPMKHIVSKRLSFADDHGFDLVSAVHDPPSRFTVVTVANGAVGHQQCFTDDLLAQSGNNNSQQTRSGHEVMAMQQPAAAMSQNDPALNRTLTANDNTAIIDVNMAD